MINIDNLSSKVTPVENNDAENHVKNAKTYAGGGKLFTRIKDSLNKVAENTPALLTIGGGITTVFGVATANPAITSAGAAIMTIGYKALSKDNSIAQLALSTITNTCRGK